MDLEALIDLQVRADRRHGFRLDFEDDEARLTQIERDLVGLFGEVGEFANLLKKVRLGADHDEYNAPQFRAALAELRSELADTAIYLMRLSVMVECDLEAEILAKMKFNDGRYEKLA